MENKRNLFFLKKTSFSEFAIFFYNSGPKVATRLGHLKFQGLRAYCTSESIEPE